MMRPKIPFSSPYLTGNEKTYLDKVLSEKKLSGNGPMTRFCQEWLERTTGCIRALLTQSCTAALEMVALLANIQPGDEVILPSFTFVTSGSAFVLRGATLVFVDIRSDTLNLDESLVEAAITPRTKAILAMHYAGVGCDMAKLKDIADRHGLLLIEDAAQAIMANFGGRPLGTIGHLGTLSFHDTKNIVSGEGGALLINDQALVARAEILWEKGTNRSQFIRGQVDKYTWVDLGSSFLPSEFTAAVLRAQLEAADKITARRLHLWHRYYSAFAKLESAGRVRRPVIPDNCEHNGHIFHLLLPSAAGRDCILKRLNEEGIGATFHYIPLHSSPSGLRYGRVSGVMTNTDALAPRLLRLPLPAMTDSEQDFVISAVNNAIFANEQ